MLICVLNGAFKFCNQLLKELNWDSEKGRVFLMKTMNVTSRQLLNDIDLQVFNKRLKELNTNGC